jgi:cardiolipin synthase
VKRGVGVRVLMPLERAASDNPMVQHAGHRNFERMMRSGVKLFEYKYTLLHQKVMTVDASTRRGLLELRRPLIRDQRRGDARHPRPRDGAKLDKIFEKYVKRADEIDVEKWAKRSIFHKIKDYAALLDQRAALIGSRPAPG